MKTAECFVSFRVLDKNNIELGFMKINLYIVATGPYHHDIEINWYDVFFLIYKLKKKKLPGKL